MRYILAFVKFANGVFKNKALSNTHSDENEYFPFDPISANALFQIILKRYEKG